MTYFLVVLDRAFWGLLCRAGSVRWEESHKRCHSGVMRKLKDSVELSGRPSSQSGDSVHLSGQQGGESRVGRKWVATLKMEGVGFR